MFQLFKYSVYLLIFINVIQFLRDDFLASEHMFRRGIQWGQITDAYATSIDSMAWLILLLMFELETYVIPTEKIGVKVRWLITAVSAVCFLFILSAFFGYIDKYISLGGYLPAAYENACSAVGAVQSYAVDLDEYFALTTKTCADVLGTAFLVHTEASILATSDIVVRMKALALTDIINAGTWIIIVIVLEIDVVLQTRGALNKRLYQINMLIKAGLYLILFAAAVYWGYLSALLDFWDALLWIIAFFFIELNLFQWNEETRNINQTLNDKANQTAESRAP